VQAFYNYTRNMHAHLCLAPVRRLAERAWYLFSREHDVLDKWLRMRKWSFACCSSNYTFNTSC